MPQNSRGDCSILVQFVENLQLVADQLSTAGETSREPAPNFVLDDFWTRFVGLTKSLSAETSKLCLGFTSAPLPGADEQSYFTGRMQQMVLALISAFYGLPKAYGALLRKTTRLALFDVIASLRALVASIVTSGIQGVSLEELTTTGEFWANCDRIEKLPRTNAGALLALSKDENAMVTDALNEIKTAKDEHIAAGNNNATENNRETTPPDILADRLESSLIIDQRDDEERWAEGDVAVVSAAMALIKTAGFVLKKMGPALKKDRMNVVEKSEAVDDLAELTRKVSPAVDDLVLVLYPPVNRDHVEKETVTLHRSLRDLLEKCKDLEFCVETEQNWISFLADAADHNRKKTLDALAAASSPSSSSS